MRWLLVIGLALGLVGLGSWRLDTASGADATLSLVDAPASVPAGGPEFQVKIWVAGVTNLGAYEWKIVYDPDVIELTDPPVSAISDGGFLGGSGRTVVCPPPILPPEQDLEPGNLRFGCGTIDPGTMPGVNGDGPLSTITFVPVAGGSPNIQFVCAGLANPFGDDIPISNVAPCVSPIIPTYTPTPVSDGPPGPGPGDTPVPTNTLTPVPGDTPPTHTPTSTGPTPIPTPTGPTPTPLPPGLEAVLLVAGCNPVTSSYPDGTPIQTIADAVGPEGNLVSLWEFHLGNWRGYSALYPQDPDLTEVDLLDVVFACVRGTGAFVRPEV